MPPTFGLNFLDNKKFKDKNFMLLCGFEKFENYYVRIDILERLFIKIMNASTENSKDIKLVPEMLNLLGCNKDNFLQLLKYMNYKVLEKGDDIYFKYRPKNEKKIDKIKNISKDSPFKVLNQINFK